MLYFKPYFYLAWGVVAFAFLLFRPKQKDSRFGPLFPAYLHYAVTLCAAIFVGWVYNLEYQVFCIPVAWAKWALGVTALWMLIWPFFPVGSWFRQLMSGWTAFVAIYLILFGNMDLLGFLVFNGIFFVPLSLVGWYLVQKKKLPFGFVHFFALCAGFPLWLLFTALAPNWKFEKRSIALFVSLPAVLLVLSLHLGFRLKTLDSAFQEAKHLPDVLTQNSEGPVGRYMLELYLGAHWKYHTRICLYDGWRPPFHDPILVMSRTMALSFGGLTELSLMEAKSHYQLAFPDQPLEFDCRCGHYERWPETYEDQKWFERLLQ